MIPNIDIEDIKASAEKKGAALVALAKRNIKRKAKGLPPLPDIEEAKDLKVLRTKYKTNYTKTIDGSEAVALFEKRKMEMMDKENESSNDSAGEDKEVADEVADIEALIDGGEDASTEKAQRLAAAVRRVQDLKAGRIDNAGNWGNGQRLEGGDDTVLPQRPSSPIDEDANKRVKVSPFDIKVWGVDFAAKETKESESAKTSKVSRSPKTPKTPKNSKTLKTVAPPVAGSSVVAQNEIEELRDDLYERLRISFDSIESALSDLQGRVSEIVTASTPSTTPESKESKESEGIYKDISEFKALLDKKIPVTFNVSGTKMTFDAITVFHVSPCITVVSKAGSATIMPKPGARLNLSYEMDGVKYTDDPVTFLGTRFDIPMFGLSFVGFIRDLEAGDVEVDQSQPV